MASANDNEGTRRIRDGYLARWSRENLAEVASDEALIRLAEARNASSSSANKFMLLAAASAFLYLLRLEGVAAELGMGGYNLRDLPFGLFVLASVATALATMSLIRSGDSRAYDRQLRLACEKRHGSDCLVRYVVFPNERAWGEPFSVMASVVDAGRLMSSLRFLSLLLINAFLFVLVISPVATGLDYLLAERYLSDLAYRDLRFWIVFFLTLANTSTLILVFWTRLSDRD